MQIVKIACKNCGAESSLSLIDSNYSGPFRCWKCRAVYTINMQNNEVLSWEPMSEEEFEMKFKRKR